MAGMSKQEKIDRIRAQIAANNAFIEREQKKADTSVGASMLAGGAQGATFGLSDEILAAMKSAPRLGGVLGGLDTSQVRGLETQLRPSKQFRATDEGPARGGPEFSKALEEVQDDLQIKREANPKAFATADVLTSIASSVLPAGAVGRTVAKAANPAMNAFARALTMASGGAVQSAGRAKQGERLQDAAVGAASGVAFGGLGKALTSTVAQFGSNALKFAFSGGAGQTMKRAAEKAALKITGALKKAKKEETGFLTEEKIIAEELAKFKDKFITQINKDPSLKKTMTEVIKSGGKFFSEGAKTFSTPFGTAAALGTAAFGGPLGFFAVPTLRGAAGAFRTGVAPITKSVAAAGFGGTTRGGVGEATGAAAPAITESIFGP